MALFDGYPTYDRYRTLKLTDPLIRGEDVYALQTALRSIGFSPGEIDGVFGPRTDWSVRAAQSRLLIMVDGLAGGGTQTALCRRITSEIQGDHDLPRLLLFGQVMHESSCRVGNYSARRSDGSYDAGAAQRNTNETPARDGFNVPESIEALALRVRQHYEFFRGIQDQRRRWELAAGSWNAPAWACRLAINEGATAVPSGRASRTVTATQKAWIEAYIASATALMEL